MDSRVTLGTRIPQDENLNIKTKSTILFLDLITLLYTCGLEVQNALYCAFTGRSVRG